MRQTARSRQLVRGRVQAETERFNPLDRVGSQERVPKGCATGPRVPAPPRRPRCRQRGTGRNPGAQPTDDVRAPPGAPRPTSVREPGSGPSAPRSSAPLEFRGEAPPSVRNLASPDPGLGPPGRATLPPRGRRISYLVDPASSHMLVSKIKPCMSKYRPKQGETANGSLNQLWFIGSYPFLLG